jgi:superfamily II helicase
MKTGKEIKTNKFKNYNVTFGSVNNKNPKAIYINISSWAQPKEEDELSYTSSIRGLNKKIRQNLFNTLSEDSDSLFDKNRTIVDLDIRESGIRYGKRSFMSCEITLYLYNEYSITTTYMKDKLEWLTDNLVKNVFENNKIFEFNKKKN